MEEKPEIEEKLDGFDKEKKKNPPGNCIKHIPKNLESQPLNLPMILGSPGNRKLCEVSEEFQEVK